MLRIVMAQLNITVGDIKGNLKKHIQAATTARDDMKADLIVFPELSLTGYPPEDLLLRDDFLQASDDALQVFINEVMGICCVISHPHRGKHGLVNSSSVIHNGKVLGHYAKQHLPNYGVFDEDRYFIPGHASCVFTVKDTQVGLVICEDAWFPEPIRNAVHQGAQIIVSPNASPFEIEKHERRLAMLAERARENQVPIVYVNNVGGQDEIIFDGGSMMVDKNGSLVTFAGFFNEALILAESNIKHIDNRLTRIYNALVLSLRDYVTKNRITQVFIGVSGGIDSALTLAIAVDALGKDAVRAIIMPSRHTSDISMEEAIAVTQHVDVQTDIISIEPTYEALIASLSGLFIGKPLDVTEENIQARCRGIILMALSNKFGGLVLTTGNRSEMAVGYCTLYGDMAGGFAVLKDVPKMLVYELAHYRNSLNPVIPERTLTRAPTAELAPNQKDEDSLPPYAILDAILDAYLNQSKSLDDIVALGFERDVVAKIIRLIRHNEYKRRQSAIGPHINHKSFGKDWRYPITNRF